jgi:hypothetical protein
MGAVYRARDDRTQDIIALKRLTLAKDPAACALFEREYRTLSDIQHPRIIRVFEYGVDSDGPYYTMELLEGSDLFALAPLPFRTACRYLRDVATSLALLHTRRLLHRDVTPRNVRITEEGHCKLLDFGALTPFGVADRVVGTPPFIAPEALHGAPLDQRADIFALGALAYWILTRTHAYPARALEDLPTIWQRRPPAPSEVARDVPAEADALIVRMLSTDPRVRPSTMVEVIERLTNLGELEPEDDATVQALARSYLAHTPLVGRDSALETLSRELERTVGGTGGVMRLHGPAGAGRTRLLHQLVVHAKLSSMQAVQVDAGMHRQPNGTAVALLRALLEASPEAKATAQKHRALLAGLHEDIAAQLGTAPVAPESGVSGDWRGQVQSAMHEVVAAAAEHRLLIAIDNLEEADEASVALLAAAARLAADHPLVLIYSDRWQSDETLSLAAQALRRQSRPLELLPLTPAETSTLLESIFGSAPNLGRFSGWLHERTAGSPLHLLEVVRQLFDRGQVRFVDNLWTLPAEQLEADIGHELEDVLATRLSALTPEARGVAEALALQRSSLSHQRCLHLAGAEGRAPYALLDELVHRGVLEVDGQGYRFSHAHLRKVLLDRMDPARRSELHVRSAEWTLASAKDNERMAANIEAGWHYLQAGDETRGADLLADVAYDTVGIRFAFADLQVVAPALEAALRVYERQGRSIYDRLPLLSALTQAGYYEDRAWGERYGEEALKLLRQVSGLDLVGKLQRWIGKWVGLLLGMTLAWIRFTAAPKARRYGFSSVLVQLFGVVTTMTGAATLALDGPRAERVARTLTPFAFLPARLTPKGIWEFCTSLAEISRENQAEALQAWTRLIERFNDPSYYRSLPAPARSLYLGGLWFARGAFESFRDRGGALDAAEALDRMGLKLYQMIASQLRALHYANRGELTEAERHKAQVELHALHVGSAWQAELWDPCAHIPMYTTLRDLVESRRVADRIETLARTAPSLALHGELARLSLLFLREDAAAGPRVEAALAQHPPRSFIGWGALCGFHAEHLNHRGEHDAALEASARALEHLNEADLEFVGLFLNLELQHAFALLGLGRVAEATAEIEALRERHASSDNPLTQGQLHEAQARLAAATGASDRFDLHLERAMDVYRSTGTSALMARTEGLKHLRPEAGASPESDQLQQLDGLAERAAHGDAQPLLERLASAWGADSCALFILRDGRLHLQYALGEEPPPELDLEVSMCLEALSPTETMTEGSATTTATVPGRAAMRASVRGYAVRLLIHGCTVVGALALRSSGSLRGLPDGTLLDRVTEGLLRGARAAHQ